MDISNLNHIVAVTADEFYNVNSTVVLSSSSISESDSDSSPDVSCEVCGWLAALCAMLAFGTFGVPIKSPAAQAVNIDPLVFQSYKTIVCFITSWIVLFVTPNETFTFTPWGIVSGLFWVPSGVATVYAVKAAGLAIGIGIGSSFIVLISFIWGIFIFHEPVHSKISATIAVSCMMLGLLGMSYFSSPVLPATTTTMSPTSVSSNQQPFTSIPTGDITESALGTSSNDDDDENEDYGNSVIDDENNDSENRRRSVTPTNIDRMTDGLFNSNSDDVHNTGTMTHLKHTHNTNLSPMTNTTTYRHLSFTDHSLTRSYQHDLNNLHRENVDDNDSDSSMGNDFHDRNNWVPTTTATHTTTTATTAVDGGKYICGGRLYLTKRQLGMLSAAFCGIYGGSILAPMKFAQTNTKGTHYLISFAIGAMTVTMFFWFIRFLYNAHHYKSFIIGYNALPSFHLRVMLVPGTISGLLWSIGNYFSLLSVLYLGEGVGYPLVQTSILVSGLWGIFYFKEIKTCDRICKWLGSSLLTIFGILLLSYEHHHTKK